jgi:hypothetical protein
MPLKKHASLTLASVTLALLAGGVGGGLASADQDHGPGPGPSRGFTASQVLNGSSLHHAFTPAGSNILAAESLSDPDDITALNGNIFVGFQNGVGPQGQPSASGNLDSTIVEFTPRGGILGQWDVTGKTDGVSADPQTGSVVATVNEDANSSLYTVDPRSGTVTHYQYNEPLPHDGGTDAISVEGGQLLISASAPGATGASAPQPTYPAVYSVSLNPTTQVATVAPVFFDQDQGAAANVGPQFGKPVQLALTDPDSNEIVPWSAPRFGGEFLLTSQGDQQQIYVQDPGGPHQSLSVLALSQAVDDTVWPTGRWGGSVYATDATHDAVDLVNGPFPDDQPVVAATPCGANSAPATCPAPPTFPANYLATLNVWTGQVQALNVEGVPFTPQGGLLVLPDDGHFPSND